MKYLKNLPSILAIALLSPLFSPACGAESAKIKRAPGDSWAERMARSDMNRNPQAWQIDFRTTPKWGYTHGLMLSALARLYQQTGNKEYLDYIKGFGDKMVSDGGDIYGYQREQFNIDKINPGKVMFFLHEETAENKYKTVIETLRGQLKDHPRTREGGFWHKKRYTSQMWLDGLYMGAPFYAQYLDTYEPTSPLFDDVLLQFSLIMKHARDPNTGLLYHGWDESRKQRWANKTTGQSPHFWSRGLGWFTMALVDTIEFFPPNHPGRQQLQAYLKQVMDAIIPFQDKKTGLWYQVIDAAGREGNYLEATGSTMFVYVLAKAVNKGYLAKPYRTIAEKGYQGILDHLIRVDTDDQEVHLMQNCAVAGLGGKPYRDGSFDYYISEPVRDNDPKGVGPFILASLELNR